jgi:hypothetical protein
MPYVNRRTYRKRPGLTKRIARSRPRAYNNKRNLLSLTKKVNKIQRKVGARNMHGIFQKSGDVMMSSGYNKHQIILPTSQPGETQMNQVFQTDISIMARQTFNIKSVSILWKAYPNNEESAVDATICLIAPKSRKILSEVYNATTGGLNLVSGKDYVVNNGLVMVNLQRFKMHYYKKTVTVAQDGPQQEEFPVRSNNGYIKLRNLNWKIYNRTANWDDTPTNDLPYYMRIFLLCFNNNNVADLEYPKFKYNALIKGLIHD